MDDQNELERASKDSKPSDKSDGKGKVYWEKIQQGLNVHQTNQTTAKLKKE